MNAPHDQLRTMRATPDEAMVALAGQAIALASKHGRRVLFGLAGGPGTGKSTLAEGLVELMNATVPSSVALVPMDGFHLPHAQLVAEGTVAEKGAPHTFDGAGFLALLQRLREAEGPVSLPTYSRKIEDVVPDAVSIPANVPVLVVEGNYLLLEEEPWTGVRQLLDHAVFIDLDWPTVRERLLRRHAEHGNFTHERNVAHVDAVDGANFDRVAKNRDRADQVIALKSET